MHDVIRKLRTPILVSLLLTMSAITLHAGGYDPLAITNQTEPSALELVVNDKKRDREIPIKLYLPAEKGNAPVILYSHGLGGSRNGGTYLGKHWSARGFAVVCLQHPGSDSTVWKSIPKHQIFNRVKALKDAANAKNFLLRVKDVSVVLDQLELWNKEEKHPLSGRMDMTKIGMSGHSFGAITTQAVSGQVVEGRASFTDKRILVALAMSPSLPLVGSPEDAFGDVTVPWMLMTGTKDTSPIIKEEDVFSRMEVFTALPEGGKYEVVLDGARHSAFSDYRGRWFTKKKDHHRSILALSTAFWDAYLRDDGDAKNWLDGDGPRSVLDPQDSWRKK